MAGTCDICGSRSVWAVGSMTYELQSLCVTSSKRDQDAASLSNRRCCLEGKSDITYRQMLFVGDEITTLEPVTVCKEEVTPLATSVTVCRVEVTTA
jgi:hypothetical protein